MWMKVNKVATFMATLIQFSVLTTKLERLALKIIALFEQYYLTKYHILLFYKFW